MKLCKVCFDRNRAKYEFDGIKGLKTCKRCGKVKFTTQFHKTKKKSNRNYLGFTTYHYANCKDCSKFDSAEWRKKNSRTAISSAAALSRRVKVYGITEAEYIEMYKNQNGKCGVCGVPAIELDRSLAIDHCHSTDKVRGLLCSKCNKGIGLLGDNSVILEKALEYICGFENKRYLPQPKNRFILFKNKRI